MMRSADLSITRDLLCAMLREGGHVLLSPGDVQKALRVDSKALRLFGDQGQIQFVAKGEKARGYTVEAVMDFIARGGIACQRPEPPVRGSSRRKPDSEVYDFMARHKTPRK